MTLEELFDKHGTDKSRHGYHNIYEPLLGPRREQVSHVLEVGVGTADPDVVSTMAFFDPNYLRGASLRAWSEYFPNATIVGLDTESAAAHLYPENSGRIVTKLCDSTEADQVNAALSPDLLFDLIIDDGNHWPPSQLATLTNLWGRLKPGGLYVIEDVVATNFPHIREIVGDDWLGMILYPSRYVACIMVVIPCRWEETGQRLTHMVTF